MSEKPTKPYNKIVILSGGAIAVETAKELAELGIANHIAVYNRVNPKTNPITDNAIRGIEHSLTARGIELEESAENEEKPLYFTTDMKKAITGADLAIAISGAKREGNESRDDVLKKNIPVTDEMALGLKHYYMGETVIAVPNPIDKLASRLQQVTGFAPERVVGLSGVLDETRLISSIMDVLGYKRKHIRNTSVIGEHGDNMVAVLSQVEVFDHGKWKKLSEVCDGINLEMIAAGTLDAIRTEDGEKMTSQLVAIKDHDAHGIKNLSVHDHLIRETALGGARFIQRTGSSDFYGPAGAVVRMVNELILAKHEGTSHPIACSSYNAQHGIYIGQVGVFDDKGHFSTPKDLQPKLNRQETATWEKAVSDLKKAAQTFPPLNFRDKAEVDTGAQKAQG